MQTRRRLVWRNGKACTFDPAQGWKFSRQGIAQQVQMQMNGAGHIDADDRIAAADLQPVIGQEPVLRAAQRLFLFVVRVAEHTHTQCGYICRAFGLNRRLQNVVSRAERFSF